MTIDRHFWQAKNICWNAGHAGAATLQRALAYRLATKLPQPDETLTIDSHFAQEESPTRAQNVYRW
jgi:hypothetical protein